MLRNFKRRVLRHYGQSVLNEVLSLNAQECLERIRAALRPLLLNEVLSLNAQE